MKKSHDRIDRHRRRLVAGAGAVLLPGIAFGQSADIAWPERNVTLYCPWAAGGPTDIAMRALADVSMHPIFTMA